MVLVATKLGAVPTVLAAVASLGGSVEARFDDVGYARVRLPLAGLATLQARDDVLDARIDGNLSYMYDRGTDQKATHVWERLAARPQATGDTTRLTLPPLPRSALAAENPYVATADMGIPGFRRSHPTFDGRGVTVAVLEHGTLAVDHPALQQALTLTGQAVPKIRGIVDPATFDREREDSKALFRWLSYNDYERVKGTGIVDASDGTFVLDEIRYHAPRPGKYHVGVYVTGGYPTEAGGPRTSDTTAYAVVWDEAHGLVWVDTNRDRDFRDETPLQDLNRAFSTGYLRRDSTAAHPVRSVPFAVSFDSGRAAVHLFPGEADAVHATAVASLAAGSHFLGGAAGGGAPGAQVILVSAGRSLGEMIEGFIRAARDPRIDMITNSQAGESFPGTGESIAALIVERVIARYGKPILVAANNAGPALSTTMEQANDPDVIAVGASVTRAAYRAHYGWELAEPEMVLNYSSRGPALNGGFKPDVLAPPTSLAAAPCSDSSSSANDPALRYTMPTCYAIGAGTSLASPAAAGVAAVLISAAKQRGLPYDARRIAWALRYAARPLPGFAPYEQGHGVVNVARAWTLLQARVELPEITIAAPVNTALNRYLRMPGQGVGLYEREGWTAGQRATRHVSFTRTSGPKGAVRYGLRWRQNDGTFSAPMTVTLPLNTPVPVPIEIAPTTTGVHSAALELIDRPSRYPVHDLLVTVVAAERLTTANGFTASLAKTIAWPRSGSFFVDVPPGVSMLRLDLAVKSGRLHLRLQDPTWTEFLTWPWYFQPDLVPQMWFFPLGPGRRGTLLVPHPQPGVWEISLEPGNERDPGDSLQYHVPAQVELHASVRGVDTAAPVMTGFGGAGSSIAAAWTNKFAPLDRAATHGVLGTLRTRRGQVDSTVPGPLYEVEVDSGTTTLRVQVTPADTTADLDLYLYDCSSGTCYLWDLDRSIRATKSHLVRYPHPGTWKVLIDPAYVPGGKTQYTYSEVLTHPKYGAVTALGPPARREAGESWTDSVGVERLRVPAPDSTSLAAVLDLVDEGAEAAEESSHPFAAFAGVPYRPVVLGTALYPLDSSQ